MADAVKEAYGLATLRQRAVDQLGGTNPSSRQRTSQVDSIAVLHQLASSPATAADAMALLHELQVHQVEVDLQQEEFFRSQSELETELRRQAYLVERAPVGYMTIDARGVLCEINFAGSQLLGAPGSELLGQSLALLLMPRSAEALQALLKRTRVSRATESCELELMPIGGVKRIVQAVADQDITPGRYLLVLMSLSCMKLRSSES